MVSILFLVLMIFLNVVLLWAWFLSWGCLLGAEALKWGLGKFDHYQTSLNLNAYQKKIIADGPWRPVEPDSSSNW